MMLVNEMPFKFNPNKKLVHIRCQFGEDKMIASQAVSPQDEKFFDLNVGTINATVETIQKFVHSYENLVENLCDGIEGYTNERNFYFQDSEADYWIRIVPVESDYNCYIYIYHK